MGTEWKVRKPKGSGGGKKAPVVVVQQPALWIEEVHFATPKTGSTAWHYLYHNGMKHADAPGDLQWWARGVKIIEPEWVYNKRHQRKACFTRNQSIAMMVKLVAQTYDMAPPMVPVPGRPTKDLTDVLTVEPELVGVPGALKGASLTFTYPANASEHWVTMPTFGGMPDEIGRYDLKLKWKIGGQNFRFKGPERTLHQIYGIYGQPMDPEYDSDTDNDPGVKTSRDDGTLSGTQKRMDHLMALIGGRDLRHAVASQADLVDLYWALHKGINDTPGAPPYFHGAHTEHMTKDGSSKGKKIPLVDQWLAWVKTPSATVPGRGAKGHWNDCSCIGHAQIAKTMLAAVGLFARRTWVFPSTTHMPDGSVVKPAHLYCLGKYDGSKRQTWDFVYNGVTYLKASPKLMEPNYAWENFEACMLSPTGKFLTGGYDTKNNPKSFHTNKGFNSAEELLRWWCNTSRPGFGKRFMAWVWHNDSPQETHFWDIDGKHYDIADYVAIRKKGKELKPV